MLTGSASTLAPCFRAGANGAIVALANIAPQYCIDIYKFEKNGEWEKAKELQMKLIYLNTMVTDTYGVPGLKFAMEKIGLYGGAGRSPLLPVDNIIEEEINKELKKLELV